MSALVEGLLSASRTELRARIVEGHPVDPDALAGWEYRGISLGLPTLVERLTWKTFQKAFWREPATGRLVGWNVRLHQDGVDAPSRPRVRAGAPWTTWYYEVTSPDGVPAPRGFDRGLIIDYGRGPNPAVDTIGFTKDPLVALEPGNSDVLLGVSYLALGRLCVETPTYFLLQRERPVEHVPAVFGASGPGAKAPRRSPLLRFERRWAELLFDALLGTRPVERDFFWSCLEERTPPYVPLGLRAAVYGLTFLPVTLARYRKPFFALDEEARLECVEALGRDERPVIRAALTTLKTLGCLALFEDPALRRRWEGPPR